MTCQDCGNQAKKDCVHRRCRTCCKSRGLDCETHVRSTWIPAARRRERHLVLHDSSAGAGGVKKARLGTGGATTTTTASVTSTSANTPSGRSLDTGSSHLEMEMGGVGVGVGLPGQLTAQAVFRCVRVTAIEGGHDEYAYQAVVKIGGRVFKGLLYDQRTDDSSSSSLPKLSDLHLGDCSGCDVAAGGSRKSLNAASLAPILDATHEYAAAAASSASGGGMVGSSNYGNPLN